MCACSAAHQPAIRVTQCARTSRTCLNCQCICTTFQRAQSAADGADGGSTAAGASCTGCRAGAACGVRLADVAHGGATAPVAATASHRRQGWGQRALLRSAHLRTAAVKPVRSYVRSVVSLRKHNIRGGTNNETTINQEKACASMGEKESQLARTLLTAPT